MTLIKEFRHTDGFTITETYENVFVIINTVNTGFLVI